MAAIVTKDFVIRLSKLVKKGDPADIDTENLVNELETIVSELVADNTVIVEVLDADSK